MRRQVRVALSVRLQQEELGGGRIQRLLAPAYMTTLMFLVMGKQNLELLVVINSIPVQAALLRVDPHGAVLHHEVSGKLLLQAICKQGTMGTQLGKATGVVPVGTQCANLRRRCSLW